MPSRLVRLVPLAAAVMAVWLAVYALRGALSPPDCPDCPDCPSCPVCPVEGCDPDPDMGDEEPAVDLLAMPAGQRKRNIAASGLGCCVFRSIEYASWWQNVPATKGFPEWMVAKGIPGGGTPSKVDKLIPQIAADRGVPPPAYVQYQGNDPSFIELALRTGRVPGVTWNGNHMLNCVHLDAQRAAIVDNNAPDRVQWMSRSQFLAKWKQGGGGWALALLASAPPPAPRSAARPRQADLMLGLGSRRSGGGRACRACNCPTGCATCTKDRCEEGCTCAAGPQVLAPDGVIWGPRNENWRPGYWIGGSRATAREVFAALTDDSGKCHLTVIGTPAERAQALARAGDVSRYRVQEYDPADWALEVGFVREGCQVYLQRPDGTVLLRHPGGAGLAAALRRADPGYDPKADPTGAGLPALGGLLPDWLRGLSAVQLAALAAAGAGGFLLLRRGQGPAPVVAPAAVVPPVVPPASVKERVTTLDELAMQLGRRRLERVLQGELDTVPHPPPGGVVKEAQA